MHSFKEEVKMVNSRANHFLTCSCGYEVNLDKMVNRRYRLAMLEHRLAVLETDAVTLSLQAQTRSNSHATRLMGHKEAKKMFTDRGLSCSGGEICHGPFGCCCI